MPTIKVEKEPEGRVRWLEPDEEERLLAACRESRTERLAAVVTVALETGMRNGEVLGLAWDRVDVSRGVIRLELTESGKRREVAMRQVGGRFDPVGPPRPPGKPRMVSGEHPHGLRVSS